MTLSNWVYYNIRPFIPRRAQIFLRRTLFKQKYKRYIDTWPIFRESIKPPAFWNGWPGEKRFAFILTHDVETDIGQKRCLELMNIDQKMGFISSFNFVPERYNVSEEIRTTLVDHGFEVGVHDLNHDGKLFKSRDIFMVKAQRINRYLKSWGSVGFRSGAMHHHLDWIHELDIEYDASTFDIDPFEPQPDGVGTIFPFWVTRDDSLDGYVELPYSLPQDFTLFVLLQEKNINIWKKKLDWIASNGGMALLITHPDYMSFQKTKENQFEIYPVEYYRELLRYVHDKYAGEYWNDVPKNVARYVRNMCVIKNQPGTEDGSFGK